MALYGPLYVFDFVGDEDLTLAWEAGVLPLNYSRSTLALEPTTID